MQSEAVQIHFNNSTTMKNFLMTMTLASCLMSCQKDALEAAQDIAIDQAEQITRVQELRRQVRADMERRARLRQEVAADLEAVDSLTRFILGTHHPDFRKYDWHKVFLDPMYEPFHKNLEQRVPGIIIKQ